MADTPKQPVTELGDFVWCVTHERLWDRNEPCPCRKFPLSSCRMVRVVGIDRDLDGKLLPSLRQVSP